MRFARVGIAFLASVMLAQTPAPRFEVATLKLSPPPQGNLININLGTFRDGHLSLNNVTLSDMVKYAYELVSDEQLAAPDWNRDVRFDIEALAAPDTPPARLHQMMQALLAERLHVVLRREEKVLRHLALVSAKDGTKLKAARSTLVTDQGTQVRGRIHHNLMPMSLLASLLSRFERQTIVDQTGLTGNFEVALEWAPDNAIPASDPLGPPSERPNLFEAVQEQLGLKLEARRSPLPVLVVEQASRVPDEN